MFHRARYTPTANRTPEAISEYLKAGGALYSERSDNKEWVHRKHVDRTAWELGYPVVKAFDLEGYEDHIVQRAAEAQGLTALPFVDFLAFVLEPLRATVNGSNHKAKEHESHHSDLH